MERAKEFYLEKFGAGAVAMIRAPGRLELLGNHTDYNEGLVMSVAVDRHIQMAVGPRKDGQIHLWSTAYPVWESFPVDQIEKNPGAPWANYSKGVLLQLRKRGVHFTGFNAAIHGTIPAGAGMSSSAALEVATALGVRQLFPFSLNETGLNAAPKRDAQGRLPRMAHPERMAVAKLCQAAESQFVGVNCGLLDQISSLFGKQGQVIQIDCLHNSVELSPMVPGVVIVVCNSGVKHDLASGDYNELRRTCEAAARILGARSLRFVELKHLMAEREKLSEREFGCAYHIVGENARVIHGDRALRSGDLEQFGQFLFQSHASSRDHFKNSCPELDVLVELAQEHPACMGARLTGGGFGGATINLVKQSQTEEFSRYMSEKYRERTGRNMDPMICTIADGAECA